MRSLSDDISRHVVIDRVDEVYQACVDVVLTGSGNLVCVWRDNGSVTLEQEGLRIKTTGDCLRPDGRSRRAPYY